MSEITYRIGKLREGPYPLYYRYPGSPGPQPAYVELDEDGEVRCDWSGIVGGGIPAKVRHRRALRWSVAPAARGADLAELLESAEVCRLLQRCHEGHAIVWEGSNHVGRLDEDAEAACRALQKRLDTFSSSCVPWPGEGMAGCGARAAALAASP